MSKQKISKEWLAGHLKEDEGHNIEAGIHHLPWLNSDSQCNLDVSKELQCTTRNGEKTSDNNPLLNVPAQYKQRAFYDLIDGSFKVCAGGYGLAECEDSEVAHAICLMWNMALQVK